MSNSVRKLKGLLRYSAAYLIVVAGCVCIILIASLLLFTNEYMNNVRESQLLTMSAAGRGVDNVISQMRNISSHLASQEDLDFNLTDKIDNAILLQRKLYAYKVSFGYFDDILIYRQDGDYLCGASSTFKMSTYFTDVYSADGMTQADFEAQIDRVGYIGRAFAVHERVRFLSGSAQEKIYFILPVRPSKKGTGTMAIFKMHKGDLLDLSGGLSGADYFVYAPTLSEKPIYQSNGSDEALFTALRDQLVGARGGDVITWQGQKYFYTYTINPDTGITQISAKRYIDIVRQLRSIQAIVVFACFVMLACGSAVVLSAARKKKEPLDSLKKFVADNFPDVSVPADAGGNLDDIRKLLDDLNNTRSELLCELDENANQLRQTVLYQLMTGGYSGHEHLPSVPGLSREWFGESFTAIADIRAVDTPQISDELLTDLIALTRQAFAQTSVNGCRIGEDVVLLLASARGENLMDREAYKRLTQWAYEKHGLSLRVGVGLPQQGIADADRSYMEAYGALRLATEEQPVIWARNANTHIIDYQFHSALIGDVQTAIREGDARQFHESLTRFEAVLEKLSERCLYAKLLCYLMINGVIGEALICWSDDAFMRTGVYLCERLSKCKDIPEYKRVMAKLRDAATEYLADEPRLQNAKLDNAKQIIEENVENTAFSFSMLCAQLDISRSNLTQQFKRQFRLTPKEYLDHLRAVKAKQYLSETNESIRSIAERLGYAGESSFSRRFKSDMNMTPGEYRRRQQLHAANKENIE